MSNHFASRRYVFLMFVAILVMVQWTIYVTKVSEEPLPGDAIQEFVPPFIPILNDYAIASGYNLLGCNIRKSMSQLSFNIMCYLNNTEAFAQNNQSLSDTWHKDRISCPGITWQTFNDWIRRGDLNPADLTKLAFVRDPEERFASFYVDKCMRGTACGNCTNVRCASKMVYDSLMAVVRNGFRKDDPAMWFEWHVAPQTWNCDFDRYLNDYHFIPIGTTPEKRAEAMRKLRKVLKFAGVPVYQIEKIVRDSESGDTQHSTYGSDEAGKVLKEIREDPYVRRYLQRTYYHDYVAFGFNMTGFVEF